MREIYIKGGARREIAVTEDGRLCEYMIDHAAEGAAEAVYVGRVERVLTGMKAAFVNIGQEKNGFLPLEERSQTAVLPKLQSGMSVLVQVKKEAQGTKGAFLTRDITLCGETVLLMPMNRYIGVSSRIEEEEDREALRDLGKRMAKGQFGLVMRSAALSAEDSEIQDEVYQLLGEWEAIRHAAPTAHIPTLLHRPRTTLDMVLDDYRPRGIDRIVTDDPALAKQMVGIAPVMVAGEDMMEQSGLAHQRDKALERRVWLDSGGTLVIDPCEAMSVIDVNTAKFTGKRDLEQTVLRTNLEACGEIARQVRLRNLSGIILIDMIDMESEEHRVQVLTALSEAFSQDRIKTVIHGFTSLGLVEMTRKKSRLPLRDEWSVSCHACGGSGRNKIQEEEHHG